MTTDMMNLRDLVEKTPDADLLRELIGFQARQETLERGVASGNDTHRPQAAPGMSVDDEIAPLMRGPGQRQPAEIFTMLPFPFPATDASSPFSSMRSSHPCLRVPDYDAALDWYVRSFDFRVVKEWPGPDGLRLAYLAAPGDNGSLIEIIGGNTSDEGVPLPEDFWDTFGPARYHHFAFSVPNHKDALSALVDRGVRVVQAPFKVPELGYSVAFVADPWGNLIELVELPN